MPRTFTKFTTLFDFFHALLRDSWQLYLPHNSKQIQTGRRGFRVFVLVFGIQVPVVLHVGDLEHSAQQEFLQKVFLLSFAHMSQNKSNHL